MSAQDRADKSEFEAGVPHLKVYGLLLNGHTATVEVHGRDSRVAVDRFDMRRCSDGFEIALATKLGDRRA